MLSSIWFRRREGDPDKLSCKLAYAYVVDTMFELTEIDITLVVPQSSTLTTQSYRLVYGCLNSRRLLVSRHPLMLSVWLREGAVTPGKLSSTLAYAYAADSRCGVMDVGTHSGWNIFADGYDAVILTGVTDVETPR